MGIFDGFYSLGKKINKVDPENVTQEEGAFTDLVPELELKMSDEELVQLSDQWERMWSDKKADWWKKAEQNRDYWLGKHHHKGEYLLDNRPIADNMIFEAVETFLPVATRQNPEPLVAADDTEAGEQLASSVQKMLVYLADVLRLKLKIKKATRHWALFYIGIMKVGWSRIEDNISTKVVHPKNIILDPDSTIDEDGYTGKFVGEYKEEAASDLILRFTKKAKQISEAVDGKLGTKVKYTEWWTKEYVFWRLRGEILGKAKNPHWNEEQEKMTVNEFGTPLPIKVPGDNHFAAPQMPYIFLSIFNLGEHPYDDTSLIEQNLALQDMINKRLKQIDRNIDSMNGGVVVSGDHFTEEQATQVSAKLRNGGTVWIPRGSVKDAYLRDNAQNLPGDVYQSLLDYRNELRNIFGTKGSSPAGIQTEKTVRGKIIASGMDTERHGGGITEYLEQFSDQIFNWWVQLMKVYYDEQKGASVLGEDRAREWVTLDRAMMKQKLTVSVKEGSLIPKDDMTKRNEAVDLWSAGALDPITLYDRLEFPDPMKSAMKLHLWRTMPQMLFMPGATDGQMPQMPMPGMPGMPGMMPGMAQPGGAGTPPVPMEEAPFQQAAPRVGPQDQLLQQVPIQ